MPDTGHRLYVSDLVLMQMVSPPAKTAEMTQVQADISIVPGTS